MATKKAATKKKAVTKQADGARGKVSAYAGKKIHKLMKLEETKIRETGFSRECWDAISNGISVETYRSKVSDSGLARRTLAEFVDKGYVELK